MCDLDSANAKGLISRFQYCYMEYRAEPRFPVRSPIRVIVPGDPARILNGDLIDVSGTGMRFLADEEVTPDEIVAIEVDSRLVLAEIRYCQTRGYKFVVGVKRLQEVAKSAELKDSGACATEMIRDLRRHISAGGEGDLQALAMKALEKIVERSEIPAVGNESILEANPAGNNAESLPSEPIPSQTILPAAYGKATNGTAGDHRETPNLATSISSEPSESGSQILATPNVAQLDDIPRHEPNQDAEAPMEVLAADVTGEVEVDVASSPADEGGDSAESESAEIEAQEPPAIDETPLQEHAAAVPHVLQAEVIEPEVIERHVLAADVLDGDVLEGDVIEGDAIAGEDLLNRDRQGAEPTSPSHDDADKPVAVGANATFQPHPSGLGTDVPGEPVSAEIESQAPVVAERPPVAKEPAIVLEGRPIVPESQMPEPVAEAAKIADAAKIAEAGGIAETAGIAEVKEVAAVASVPVASPASASPRPAQETDPLAARIAEIGASYLAEEASRPARRSSWRVPVAIAAALVLACAIVFLLVQRRTQASSLAPSSAPPIAIQPAAVTPPPVPAASPAPTALDVPRASIPSPVPAPAKKVGVHHVQIKFVAKSWVMVVADGGKLFQTVLEKDAVHEFDFSQKAFVRLGNAAGTEVTVDGASVGTLKGKAVLFELTPQGLRYR
jgi:hypothetical protein